MSQDLSKLGPLRPCQNIHIVVISSRSGLADDTIPAMYMANFHNSHLANEDSVIVYLDKSKSTLPGMSDSIVDCGVLDFFDKVIGNYAPWHLMIHNSQ